MKTRLASRDNISAKAEYDVAWTGRPCQPHVGFAKPSHFVRNSKSCRIYFLRSNIISVYCLLSECSYFRELQKKSVAIQYHCNASSTILIKYSGFDKSPISANTALYATSAVLTYWAFFSNSSRFGISPISSAY